MKPLLHAFSILVVLVSLNACRMPGKQSPNVGPFDADGNYVEAWADTPSKWRPYTPKEVEGDPPKIAKHEQPPDTAVPIPTGGPSPTHTAMTTPKPKPEADRTVAKNSPKPKHETDRTVAKNSPKPKPEVDRTVAKNSPKSKHETDRTVAKNSPKSKHETDRTVAKNTSKSKAVPERTVKSSSKSKTKPSVAKAKPKATPTVTHHTVKKGDSLYSLAAHYGTSVSAIKKANGISGTLIRDGRTLDIPHGK
ncbi:MAG: LysM peptidoglycan-binding domain-containing protein [Verrucomicrobia bacterium]|nr:LysM peptidoglycan-binding domain-containing protein [Verrucomicrobiota bacterium]